MTVNNFSILYIDDDFILKEQYMRFLRLYCKEVYEASNEKDALEKYYIYKPDVVILDINSPKINGIKIAKEIQEVEEDIILVVLSKSSDTEKILSVLDLKLFKYLLKPMKTFELETLLKKEIPKAITKKKRSPL